MALQSVQTYEVNGNGVLTAVPNFIFQTDTSGSAILGGCSSDIVAKSYLIPTPIGEFRKSPALQVNGFGNYNIFGDYGTSSTVTAGTFNLIEDGEASFIGAGQNNFISGRTVANYSFSLNTQPHYSCCINHGSRSFIGGGTRNQICSTKSVIAGGHNNCIIGGIKANCIPANPAAPYNIASIVDLSGEFQKNFPSVGGIGQFDLFYLVNGPGYNGILGGRSNQIAGIFSTIAGGNNNQIISSNLNSTVGQNCSQFSLIGGGDTNKIINSSAASIVGGKNNIICSNLVINGYFGGQFIGGGCDNIISGSASSSILGGTNNRAISDQVGGRSADNVNAILGGSFNIISGGQNIIAGGISNKITFACCSSILGGNSNTITANCSIILGGNNITVSHCGVTFIGDHALAAKTSVSNNTFIVDFSGIILKSQYVPSSSTSVGYSGQIAMDSNYFYSHNGVKWRRTALSEW